MNMKKDDFMKKLDELVKTITESEKFLDNLDKDLQKMKVNMPSDADINAAKLEIGKLSLENQRAVDDILKGYEKIFETELHDEIRKTKKISRPAKSAIKKPKIRPKI